MPAQRGCRLIRRLTVPPLDALEPFLPRLAGADPETRRAVRRDPGDVLARGDEAVREYTRQFDGVDLAPDSWELDSATWQSALGRIAPALREALSPLGPAGAASTTSVSGRPGSTWPRTTAA